MPEFFLSVRAAGREFDGWESAAIESDILTPGDAFSLTHAYDPRVYEALRLDAEVDILINGSPVMNGFVTSREGDGSGFQISGKDRISRMIAESAPLAYSYAGKDLRTAALELGAPWFERVAFSNTENRDVLRGAGKKARGAGRPLLNPGTDARQVAVGTSKWEALDELLERAGYLAWSSADGKTLIIAAPDYDQEAQFAFHVTREGSNCRGIRYRESNDSRYALIVAVGAGAGDDVNHAANTTQRMGWAKDFPDHDEGIGGNFLHPKRLLLPVEARSGDECYRLAAKERAEREAVSFEVEVEAWSWGQVIGPASEPTLYAPDTVITAHSDNTPVHGNYYVTARTFQLSRGEESCSLRCVPLRVQL